jgi:hypothetical protein
MSLTKQSDLTNDPSANHRTEIHLARPDSQPDATGSAHLEFVDEDPKMSDPAKNLSTILTPNKPEVAPIVTDKGANA